MNRIEDLFEQTVARLEMHLACKNGWRNCDSPFCPDHAGTDYWMPKYWPVQMTDNEAMSSL